MKDCGLLQRSRLAPQPTPTLLTITSFHVACMHRICTFTCKTLFLQIISCVRFRLSSSVIVWAHPTWSLPRLCLPSRNIHQDCFSSPHAAHIPSGPILPRITTAVEIRTRFHSDSPTTSHMLLNSWHCNNGDQGHDCLSSTCQPSPLP